jgi:hypothetical protein
MEVMSLLVLMAKSRNRRALDVLLISISESFPGTILVVASQEIAIGTREQATYRARVCHSQWCALEIE